MRAILLSALLCPFFGVAQVGIGTTSVNASAKLQVDATTQGFLPPRVALASTATAANTISSPATGLLVYNTATAGSGATAVTPGFYYYDGSKWQRIINQQPDATVTFDGSNPNTGMGATNFSGTQQSTDFIYVSNTNNSQWTWNGTAYVTYTPPASTPWFLSGGTTDAGSNKADAVYRTGSVGIGSTTTPNANAQLDVNSTTKGFLPPRMTSTQRDAITSPAGMMVYNSTDNRLDVLQNSTWRSMATLNGTETLTNKTITGLVASTITGGTGTTQTLTYKTTTGVGASGADHIFQVGNNGATEAMRITNAGNVGIGTNSPTATLEVGKPDGTVMGYLVLNPTTSGSGVEGAEINLKPAPTGSGATWVIDQAANSSTPRFRIFNGNVGEANGLTILDGGNVGIGNATPSAKLSVNGSGLATAWNTTSDARLKDVLQTWKNDDKIDFVQYRWKNGLDGKDHYGYLAQEVQKVLPDAVSVDNEGMMSVNYDEVHSFKISNMEREIKELKQVIEELKKKGKRRRSRR